MPTANDWLSILQRSNQLFLLEPYFENIGKRLVKTPKLYLHDTGLLCFLLGITENAFTQSSPLAGPIWETFVFNQIKRAIAFHSTSATVWLWRDQHKNEVDFIVSNEGKLHLIEAKFSEQPSPVEFVRIKKIRERIGPKAVSASIATPLGVGYKTASGTNVVNAVTMQDWLNPHR